MIHKFTVPDDIYNNLNNCIKDKTDPYNQHLVGNIAEEYSIYEYKNLIEEFLLYQIGQSKFMEKHLAAVFHPNPQKLKLTSLWVNFQKKHEFNPIHNHDGVFSFIIFMKIPYTMQNELKKSPGIKSNLNLAGHLSFVFLGDNGQDGLQKIHMPADKTWEKQGLLFKSHLNHIVYPFYSSDDYRITISGNFCFDNSNIMLNEPNN